MATDITLWQMLNEPRTQKQKPSQDYISALYAEYKRNSSSQGLQDFRSSFQGDHPSKIVGHVVGEAPPPASPREHFERRESFVEKIEPQTKSRSVSFASDTGSQTMTKTASSPTSESTKGEQVRKAGWFRRSSSANSRDLDSFVLMAFGG